MAAPMGLGPGATRGWRSRGHHEHVDGDYKNPPPKGKHDKEFEQSKKSMKRKPVALPAEARPVACKEFVEALQFHGVEVAALCIGRKHWHARVRFQQIDPDAAPLP